MRILSAFCQFFKANCDMLGPHEIVRCLAAWDLVRRAMGITVHDDYLDNFSVASPIVRDCRNPANPRTDSSKRRYAQRGGRAACVNVFALMALEHIRSVAAHAPTSERRPGCACI